MNHAARALLDGPTPEQLRALCRKHGCTWVENFELPGGQVAHYLECGSHRAKVRLLDDLAAIDAFNPWIRRFAERIAARAPSSLAQVTALHAWVRDNVVHTEEPIETFSPPRWVLESRMGDCDDAARALLAMLRTLGHVGRLATLGDPPAHVAAQVAIGDSWHWLETTVAAEPGEHPLDAAERLGISTRPDLR